MLEEPFVATSADMLTVPLFPTSNEDADTDELRHSALYSGRLAPGLDAG